MATWTYINSVENGGGAGSTTLTATLTGTSIAVGDLVLVASGGVSFAVSSISDGTTTITTTPNLRAENVSVGNHHVQGWWVSAISGLPTYTVTYAGSATARELHIYVVRPSATSSFDVSREDSIQVSPATAVSGNVTVAGPDELCLVSCYHETAQTFSGEVVNSVPLVQQLDPGGNMSSFYTTHTGGGFTSQGSMTPASNGRMLTNILAMKIAGVTDHPITAVSGSYDLVGIATVLRPGSTTYLKYGK